MIFKLKTKIKCLKTELDIDLPTSFFLPIYLYVRIDGKPNSDIKLFATELDGTPILSRPIIAYNIEKTIDTILFDTEFGTIEFLYPDMYIKSFDNGEYENLFLEN